MQARKSVSRGSAMNHSNTVRQWKFKIGFAKATAQPYLEHRGMGVGVCVCVCVCVHARWGGS